MSGLARRPDIATTEQRSAPLVLTVSEAADLLRISRDLAYELIARGELPSLHLGRRIVVPVKALVDLVDGPLASIAAS